SSRMDARIAYSAGAPEVAPAGPTDSRTDAIRAMGISRGCPASLHRPRMSRTGVAGNDKDVSLQPEPRPDGASSAKLVDEVNRHEEPHSLRPFPGTHPQRRRSRRPDRTLCPPGFPADAAGLLRSRQPRGLRQAHAAPA